MRAAFCHPYTKPFQGQLLALRFYIKETKLGKTHQSAPF